MTKEIEFELNPNVTAHDALRSMMNKLLCELLIDRELSRKSNFLLMIPKRDA